MCHPKLNYCLDDLFRVAYIWGGNNLLTNQENQEMHPTQKKIILTAFCAIIPNMNAVLTDCSF